MPVDSSEVRAAKLKDLFQEVDLPEIQGIDFSKMSHQEIAALLPAYGGKHPMKGILIDKTTGQAFGMASGFGLDEVAFNGMEFKSGAISAEAAAEAGGAWRDLSNHLEGVSAAFMRKHGITDAVLYMNGRNPCWGTPVGTGCYFKLPELLGEDFHLSVYNKHGHDFLPSVPDRQFHFTGSPD